jgi:hypothetical protein
MPPSGLAGGFHARSLMPQTIRLAPPRTSPAGRLRRGLFGGLCEITPSAKRSACARLLSVPRDRPASLVGTIAFVDVPPAADCCMRLGRERARRDLIGGNGAGASALFHHWRWHDPSDERDRILLITGASSGIDALALADAALGRGDRIVATARDARRLADLDADGRVHGRLSAVLRFLSPLHACDPGRRGELGCQ